MRKDNNVMVIEYCVSYSHCAISKTIYCYTQYAKYYSQKIERSDLI